MQRQVFVAMFGAFLAGGMTVAGVQSAMSQPATEGARTRVEPDGAIVYGWPGDSQMREDYTYRDEDGVLEHWSLSAWGDGDRGFSYWFFDYDGDGQPDSKHAFIGAVPNGASLDHLTFDSHEGTTGWAVRLPGEDGSPVAYTDLNGDGQFDNLYLGGAAKHYILLDMRWRQVLGDPKTGPQQSCVVDADGHETPVEFSDGQWQQARPK